MPLHECSQKGHTKTPSSALVSTSPRIGGFLIQSMDYYYRQGVESIQACLHEVFKAKSLLSIVMLRHSFLMLKKFFATCGYAKIGLCNLVPHCNII